MFETVDIPQDSKTLLFLYKTVLGRVMLKVLSSRMISRVAGLYMDSAISTSLIPRFAKQNNIDLTQYEEQKYYCFNDFFIRKIKTSLRPINRDENVLIAPCDGLLSTYKITDHFVVPIKQSEYSIYDLVGNKRVADEYKDGICLVFRLCVNHYHRYCYIDSGKKSQNVYIPGCLHTVRPIALDEVPVFTRNSREYTLIKTSKFGTLLQMEVGAMLVGRICNHQQKGYVTRGEEKGYFQYGGSTVVVLIKRDKVDLSQELFDATDDGKEVPVIMGQALGKCIEKK